MTLICMNEMTWLMHDDDWCPFGGWECFGYQGFLWNDGLMLIPDTSSGLNGCRYISVLAWVAGRYRENLTLCIISCPSLLGIWSVLPWLWPIYWYWFSLFERFAPILTHSCNMFGCASRIFKWSAPCHQSLLLIGRTPRWFAPNQECLELIY